MKRILLLRVKDAVNTFGPLIEAAGSLGLRVGWLAMREPTLPAEMAAAADFGIHRCAVAGSNATLIARVRRGPAVFQDLLRLDFLGCDVVLVDGELEVDELRPAAGGRWIVVDSSGRERTVATSQLVRSWQRRLPVPADG